MADSATREIEEAIADSDSAVVVFFGENFHPGARSMSDRVRRLVLERSGMKFIEVSLASCIDWAARYQVVGTPTLLIFERGKIAGRLIGVHEEAVVRSQLDRI